MKAQSQTKRRSRNSSSHSLAATARTTRQRLLVGTAAARGARARSLTQPSRKDRDRRAPARVADVIGAKDRREPALRHDADFAPHCLARKRSCVTISTAMPSLRSRSISAANSLAASGSRPEVGSSSTQRLRAPCERDGDADLLAHALGIAAHGTLEGVARQAGGGEQREQRLARRLGPGDFGEMSADSRGP